MKFYIADMHLAHTNIIRLSHRPFTTVDEMDEALINNWNSVVSDNDDVFVLGDIIYKTTKGYTYYLNQLKGRKHLIVGNHDEKMLRDAEARKRFVTIENLIKVEDGPYKIVLCHYPIVEWDGFFRNTIHFYGHIHNNETNKANKIMKDIRNAYNIGADLIGLTPRTAQEIIERTWE